MLLRLAYLGIANTLALLRLPPGGDRDKDIEILSLRHQLAVLPGQLDERIRFEPVDRAWLAAPLQPTTETDPAGSASTGPARHSSQVAMT